MLAARSPSALLLPLLLPVVAAQKRTRHKDDRPSEAGFDIVARMQQKLGKSDMPVDHLAQDRGNFFYEYQTAEADMHAANEAHLTPAAEIDDEEIRAAEEAARAGVEWQQAQVKVLRTCEEECVRERARLLSSKTCGDVQSWKPEVVAKYLLDSGVVDEDELPKLSAAKQVSVAKDLAKLHRLFEWAFESTPDEEARQISRKVNQEIDEGRRKERIGRRRKEEL